jgi:integrase
MPKLVDKSLTDAAVRKAKPLDRRYDLYDALLRGFGLRVAVSGTKTWFVMRRINGRMVRATVGRYPELSLAEAREKAGSMLARMSEGEHPKASRGPAFVDVLEEWLVRDQGKNRSVDDVRSAMKTHVVPTWAAYRLTDVRRRDILRTIDRVVDLGAPVQANRVLAYLRRFFNWCVERDLLEANPAAGIKGPAKETNRERVLSREELGAVFQACERIGYPWGPMVMLLVLTGQRLVEVANLTWDEVNLDKAEWSLPGNRTKNGRPHTVHLSKPALALLQSLPRVDGQPWLFSTTGRGPVKGFSKAKKRFDRETGISGWQFHDLRRSFATHATETLGISPVVIDRILNHVSGAVKGVAAVYQRGQYLDDRRRALDAWGQFVTADMGTASDNVVEFSGKT